MSRRLFTALLAAISLQGWHATTYASDVISNIDIEHTSERRMRGAEIVMDICLSCHDVRYLKYRNLTDVGFTETQLQQKHINQDPNRPFESAMTVGDREAMFGRVPPDLSLIVSAREGGARYVYTLFTSFYTKPSGETGNSLRPGIKMPDIFGYATVTDPAEKRAIEERIHDVAAFLHWVSFPHEAARHELGYYVIGYLSLLTLLLYLVKRQVWRRLLPQGR